MKEHLVSLAAYNLWANKKIENFVRTVSEENGNLVQKSSFPTIKETIIHIWNAQAIWLDRLHNISVLTIPGKDFMGTTLGAAAMLVENSNIWMKMVDSLDENKIHESVDYKNLNGDEFINTWAQIITHVMNHGTYHRGQLVTMLRGTGLTDLSSTDLTNFYREKAQ